MLKAPGLALSFNDTVVLRLFTFVGVDIECNRFKLVRMDGYQSSATCKSLSNMTTYEDCLEECLDTGSSDATLCRAITFDSQTQECNLLTCDTTSTVLAPDNIFVKRECNPIGKTQLTYLQLLLLTCYYYESILISEHICVRA